jgi:hypothetical protein
MDGVTNLRVMDAILSRNEAKLAKISVKGYLLRFAT